MNSLQFSWCQYSRTEGVVCAGVIADRVSAHKLERLQWCQRRCLYTKVSRHRLYLPCVTSPSGVYKAEHRFDKPNPYFFVRSVGEIDPTLRYSQTTLRAAILVSYLPSGAGVGVYSGRNRPPPAKYWHSPKMAARNAMSSNWPKSPNSTHGNIGGSEQSKPNNKARRKKKDAGQKKNYLKKLSKSLESFPGFQRKDIYGYFYRQPDEVNR